MCSPLLDHWVLIWIGLEQDGYEVSLYDSRPSGPRKQVAAERQRAVHEFLFRLWHMNPEMPTPPRTISIIAKPTPQQPEKHECGFAVISNATRLWAGLELKELG
jgi:hypothetical protein